MVALVGRGGSRAEDHGGIIWWAIGRGGMVGMRLSFSGGFGVWWVCLVFPMVAL